MTDDRLHPVPPDDAALDEALATMPRIAPGRGFADRILRRVRHPLPTWLVPGRDWLRGVTSGIRGWILLAVLSLATLAGWGTVGVAAWQQRHLIERGAELAAANMQVGAVAPAFGLRDVLRDRVFDWLPLALPALKFFLILYLAVALVSAIALWWLMRTPNMRNATVVLFGALTLAPASPLRAQEAAPAAEIVGYSARLNARRALIDLQYTDGRERRIVFADGQVMIDNAVVGTYARDGVLERIWRRVVGADFDTPQMLAALRALPVEGLEAADAATHQALLAQIQAQVPAPPGVAAPAIPDLPPMPDIVVEPNVQVRVGTNVGPRAVGPPISTVPGGLLALFGTLIALSAIALGASFFAERQLDVMADTVQHSLARSFFVGLFAQPLILPVLGALIVGLMLTIVGIIVVPFAIAGYLALLAVGFVGGYLAVARATGTVFLQRRGKDPLAGGMSMVRSVMAGLILLLALWLPAILLGWVPLMGSILRWSAVLLTWGLATTGFGAALLTRGGVRGTFGRRFRGLPVPFSQPLTIPDDDVEPAEAFSTAEWLAGKRRS